jgi:predicted AAA+ superfamily ATPase
MAYHPRTLEGRIRQLGTEFPALLLTGPRQAGKTTLLRHLAGRERRYVSLDDPAARELARSDPRLLVERFPPPVLIDEIQYAPQLLPYIKLHIDDRRTAGAFWLTGSQQFQMMKGITETLAGRVAVLNLLGFSGRERRRWRQDAPPFLPVPERITARGTPPKPTNPGAVFEEIWRGGMPELAVEPRRDRDVFLGSYLQTYLQRDVRDLSQVGSLEAFTRFIRACAARTGQLLNLSELARDVDISVPTAKSWMSVLAASFQVFLLPPYHTNVTKRLVKTPKLYFLDTGLCSYLTGWSSPETLASGAMAGPILETHVVVEILKSWWHQAETPPLYFYRDRDRREIDLVFDLDGRLYPVEIKRAATVRREWAGTFAPLRRLRRPVAPGMVLCLAPAPLPLGAGVQAAPVGWL